MSTPPHYDTAWLDQLELTGPAHTFAQFCKTELVRRSQIEEDFDHGVYAESVKLVLRQLGALELEDMQ